MFKFFLLAALVFVCNGAPQHEVPIVHSENVLEDNGNFHYSYESGDGTKVHEEGTIKAGAKPDEAIETVQGGYEWSSPEGQKFVVQYTADEHGYHPSGDGIPESIAKGLAYIEAHPEQPSGLNSAIHSLVG